MSESAGESEKATRAAQLRTRIAAKGLTIAEFARKAGFTRNVMYGLSKGRAPRDAERARIDEVLGFD